MSFEQCEERLVLLREMQAQHRIQPVEGLLQVADVVGHRPGDTDLVEQATEPADQVPDLAVGAAHRRDPFVTENRRQRRIHLLVLALLMGQQVLDEPAVQLAQVVDARSRARVADRPCRVAHPLDARREVPVLDSETAQ